MLKFTLLGIVIAAFASPGLNAHGSQEDLEVEAGNDSVTSLLITELNDLREQVTDLIASINGEVSQLRNQVDAIEASNAELRRLLIGKKVDWYSPLNGYQYKVTPSSQSWEASRRICQSWDGDLAMHGIRSLESRLKIVHALSLTSNYGIGATDEAVEGNWKWLNGDNATTEQMAWWNNRPDNFHQEEHCAQMVVWSPYHGKSEDIPCNHGFVYGLCEKPI